MQEKGVSALESLLFAKYQMYRNVYWHHAVRSATCMFKRAVRGAVGAGDVTVEAIADATDDGLMELLISRDRERRWPPRSAPAGCTSARSTSRPATCPRDVQPWVADDPGAARAGGGRRGRPRWGWRRASCCWIFRRAPRCSAWIFRSAPGAAPSSASPTRAGRDSSACPEWPTSSTAAPGGSGSSWRGRPSRSLDGVLDLLTWPADEVARRLADEVSLV